MIEKFSFQIESQFSEICQRDFPLSSLYSYHFQSGGKRLRGVLSMLEAEHLKVSHQLSLRWATACELLHNATLIHDDIQDKDPIRRGQPSLWKKFGSAQAINTGDLMIIQAFDFLSDMGIYTEPLLKCLSYHAQKLVDGQTLEFQLLEQKTRDFWQDYTRVAYWKTGSLIKAPIQGIHILNGLNFADSLKETEVWRQVGLTYQICDDIRDFFGLKQKDQIQKDFEEKKINSLIALLSVDSKNWDLIHDYLEYNTHSDKWIALLLKLNNEIHKQHIVEKLQKMISQQLEDFKKTNSCSYAKELVIQYLSKDLPEKEEVYDIQP